MDTAWFAVDRDGHVALFETGESGAAPSEALLEEDYFELIAEVGRAVPHEKAVRNLAGLLRVSGQPHFTPRGAWSVLVFLKDVDDALKARLTELGAEAVDVNEGHGWIVPKAFPNKAFFDELHARDLCLGCFMEIERDDDDVNVLDHGLYRYEHTAENWISGPYVQVGKPKKPVRIEELPAEVATKAIEYDGSFADAAPIQPAEIWECESWQPNWLATDEKTVRPFPGRLDEMDDVAGNLDGQEGLVVLREALEDLPRGKLYAGKTKAASPKIEEKDDDEAEPPKPEAPKKPWWKFW